MFTWANIMPFEMYTSEILFIFVEQKKKIQIKLIVCVMKT